MLFQNFRIYCDIDIECGVDDEIDVERVPDFFELMDDGLEEKKRKEKVH